MPYHFEWVVPKRIALAQIKGYVAPDEVTTITLKSRDMLLEGQVPVHFIIDTAELDNLPFSLPNLTRWSANIPKERVGWWIIIKPGKMTIFAITIVSKMLNIKIKTADSIDEGIQILTKIDQTLSIPLQPTP
ncbi:MAG: hypothetical protein LCI00_14555 [Chloroflexi bacterium]|nr:hypothetical protein [Chloroflexota bacterium]MCC6897043.1 hypothetical protein [Anaerolineae bacterium]